MMADMGKHRKTREKDNRESAPGYHCRGRIWIEKDGETFIGYGRVVLLERIRDHGSISGAAKSMKMSYKQAWDLVDSMNRKAAEPLVTTATGGRGGGGASLTGAGEEMISTFHTLHRRLQTFLREETGRLGI
jgi:molybdate transport system regulatory protein